MDRDGRGRRRHHREGNARSVGGRALGADRRTRARRGRVLAAGSTPVGVAVRVKEKRTRRVAKKMVVGDVAVERARDLAPLLDGSFLRVLAILSWCLRGARRASSRHLVSGGTGRATDGDGKTRARAGRTPVVFDLRLLPGRLLCDLSLERGDVDLTGEGRGVGGVSRAGEEGLGHPRGVAQMWFPSRNGGSARDRERTPWCASWRCAPARGALSCRNAWSGGSSRFQSSEEPSRQRRERRFRASRRFLLARAGKDETRKEPLRSPHSVGSG